MEPIMAKTAKPCSGTNQNQTGTCECADILADAPIGFFIAMPDGKLTSVNPFMARMFGHKTPVEMLSAATNIFSRIADSDAGKELKRLSETCKAIPDLEYLMMRQDGSHFWALIKTKWITGSNGNVVRMHGFITDISEHKKTAEKLREKETWLQQIIQASPIPAFVIDQDHKITHWNKALEIISGLMAESMIGSTDHWKAFYTQERPCLADLLVDQALDDIPKWYPEKKVRQGLIDGVYEGTDFFPELGSAGKWLHFTAIAIKNTRGEVIGAIEGLEDITEIKQTEKEHEKLQNQLLLTQKMDSVGILAGGVAHEFNNLFQILRGNIEILDMDKPEGHPDKERLRTIEKHIKIGSQLIRQLMLFSRREAPRREMVDLNQQVRETLSFLAKTILKRSKVELRLSADIWLIHSDPHQIEQVLFNLCTNAADAMPEGGKITVETRNVSMDAKTGKGLNLEPGRYVLMTVTDTGSGMDSETLKHMFEPFFTTRGVGKGTGLGLASVYGIVKAHQGIISCRSKPGEGTTFNIYWPASGNP
jgi:PAS domain S-box-containing protein